MIILGCGIALLIFAILIHLFYRGLIPQRQALAQFVSWLLLSKRPYLHLPFFILSVVFALTILIAGLTTPMIEIDARIEHLDFHLIGTKISFGDQVIFFQSKSILDVVKILLDTGKYDSILVGVLILVFSIFFPIIKLVTAGFYLISKRIRNSRIAYFFAFKSGKWSMADVQVIAIFMAYIGFKGILDDQLSNLNINQTSITSVATNHTTLQPGYILLIGFVLLD